MWQPIRIKLQNLFSHKDTEYFFQRNKCVMIYGKNKTDIDKDSNGGGKSTIMEAITLAITNQTSRDVSKDDFINEEENQTFIEFELENKVGSVNHLIIRRWIDRKKATRVQLVENGKINTDMTSVNECNARIYELIGLNREDLLHFFLIGQETNYSFLTASDTDKKNIVSRLINIDFINQKIDYLKKLSKDKNIEKNELQKDIIQAQTRLDVIDESISDLKDNYESNKKKKMSDIKSDILKLEGDKILKEDLIADRKSKSYSYQDGIQKNKWDSEKSKTYRSQIKKIELSMDSNNLSQRKNKNKIKNLENVMSGAITCPKCLEKFLIDSEIPLEDIPSEITALQSANDVFIEDNEKLNEKIEELNEKIEEQSMLEEKLLELKRKKRNVDNEIEEFEDSIKSINRRIKSKEVELEDLKKESVKDKISELSKSKEEWNEAILIFSEEIFKIDKEIENYDFWIVNFGKKGFTTFLVNKAIKSIEGITNSYLQKINSNCQIQINGYTILKSGDVNEKISIEVIEDGFRKGNFFKYSGGEKGRIKLANIFGLQHLINLTCPSGGLNLLTLDEVFEGLDSTGQIEIIKVLENIGITSLVVTHRSQPIGSENEIFIEKINRISRIV